MLRGQYPTIVYSKFQPNIKPSRNYTPKGLNHTFEVINPMQMLGHQEIVVFYELFVTYFSFRQSVTSFRLITMDQVQVLCYVMIIDIS